MKYVPGNAQHIGARQEQQDAFAFSDPSNKAFLVHGGLLALVSDGMGGLNNGQQASMAAVRAFLAAYERKTPQETIPAAMRRGLHAAFEVVRSLNPGDGGQSGATLVAAVAHGSDLHWVSVGDSRLYLIRRGRLAQLTRDHSYREQLFDQVADDQLELADAMAHPEREHLTSYLGMVGSPEIDANVRPFPLEPGDQVILCTDGIYRVSTEQDFVSAFAQSPSHGCEALKSAVLSRASEYQDNLTVIAFRCVDNAPKAAYPLAGLRPKLVMTAACALFCANLIAAGLAWTNLQHQMRAPVPAPTPQPRQKDIGPGPTPPVADPHKELRKTDKIPETQRPSKQNDSGTTPPAAGEKSPDDHPMTPLPPQAESKPDDDGEISSPSEKQEESAKPAKKKEQRREENRVRERGSKPPEIFL